MCEWSVVSAHSVQGRVERHESLPFPLARDQHVVHISVAGEQPLQQSLAVATVGGVRLLGSPCHLYQGGQSGVKQVVVGYQGLSRLLWVKL